MLHQANESTTKTTLSRAELLFYAAQGGDTTVVKDIIRTGVDVNRKVSDRLNGIPGLTTALLAAADNAHLETMTELLNKGADCNITNDMGENPLMIAAKQGNLAMIRLILLYKETVCGIKNINAATINGMSALIFATQAGHLPAVIELLRCGADATLISGNNAAAIHYASLLNNVACLQAFITHDKNCLECRTQLGATPLVIAAATSHAEVVSYLLSAGACVFSKDNDGMTAMDYAERHNIQKILYLLKEHQFIQEKKNISLFQAAAEGDATKAIQSIELGADIDCMTQPPVEVGGPHITPLMIAAYFGHIPVMKELLKQGASSVIQASNKATALNIAVYKSQLSAVRLLIQHNNTCAESRLSYINHLSNTSSAIHNAAYFCAENDEDGGLAILDELIRSGANIELEDPMNKATALNAIATTDNIQFATRLLEANANVNHPRKMDYTPIMDAVCAGKLLMVRFLLIFGIADFKLRNKNNDTVLHLAAETGHLNILSYLLEITTLEINTIGHKHRTPLLQAIVSNQHEIVRFLLKAGANSQTRDISGNTGLMLAVMNGNVPIIKELLPYFHDHIDDTDDTNNTALTKAIRGQNLDSVTLLVEAGASLTRLSSLLNVTPITIAKKLNKQEVVDLLEATHLSRQAAESKPQHSPLQSHSVFSAVLQEDEEEPDPLCCPLTRTLMKDPVTFMDTGISYERSVVHKWIETNHRGPLNEKLPPGVSIDKLLTPNRALKDAIELFIRQRDKAAVGKKTI